MSCFFRHTSLSTYQERDYNFKISQRLTDADGRESISNKRIKKMFSNTLFMQFLMFENILLSLHLDSYLAVDNTEVGHRNRIPLWLFGQLY